MKGLKKNFSITGKGFKGCSNTGRENKIYRHFFFNSLYMVGTSLAIDLARELLAYGKIWENTKEVNTTFGEVKFFKTFSSAKKYFEKIEKNA